jgi:uncharacterized protein (DUF2236 family)
MSRPTTPPATVDQWRSLRELLGLLLGPLPGLPDVELLADSSPDGGLFGPGSVTWRVGREPLLLLGGGRALLMQVAHPLVAQAVVDHSDYATDPFGRLARTVRWLVAVTFGTNAEARESTAEVIAVHRHVRGRLAAANATPALAAATPYSAEDAELGRWVHATIVQSMLVTCDALVAPLARDDRDAMVREWDAVAGLLGVPTALLWRDAAELDAYVDSVGAGLSAAVPASRTAAQVVLHPPLPSPALRPAFASVGFLSVGLLPAGLRSAFAVPWTHRQARVHAATCAALRAVQRRLPRALRVSPLYDAALSRAAGRGLPRSSAEMRHARRWATRMDSLAPANQEGAGPFRGVSSAEDGRSS